MTERMRKSWRAVSIIALLSMILIVIAAALTGMWVLTALPIGFLFGFFLEKADLCGSSAFSEAFMFKDWRKLQGIWVTAVVSMLGFALLSGLGLVKLNPKPFIWANYVVGGAIFGIGIVLAGGCVSGSLFKSGQGNLNSMAALVGIPLGVSAVAYGPLHGFAVMLKKHMIKAADGGSVTLSSITHLPYWLLAVIIAAATLAVAIIYTRRKKEATTLEAKKSDQAFLQRILTRPWKPWQAGIAIGILAGFAYLSSAASGRNYPLGVTHGVMDAEVLITDYPVKHIWHPKGQTPKIIGQTQAENSAAAAQEPDKEIVWWLVLEIICIVLGSFVSANMSGKFRFAPRPPDETVIAFFGGIMTGAGAAIAGGCVVGNIMSGIALMSVGNLLFAVVVLLANWATTFFYMMGGQRGQG